MNSSHWFFYDAYDFSEKGSVIFEHKMCRITSVIEDEIWLQEDINSNREINYENFTSQSSEKTHFSIHHQKSFSPSPFHAYIGIPASASAAATSFWVEKILQAHQRTRAPSSTRDSIRTAACAVTWVHPTMRAPERGLSPAARFLKHFQLWRYCVSNFLVNSNMPNLTHWRRCVQKCVFLVFRSKFRRVSFNIFSSENNLNRQKSISFRIRLLWKSYNQAIGLGGQKNSSQIQFQQFLMRFAEYLQDECSVVWKLCFERTFDKIWFIFRNQVIKINLSAKFQGFNAVITIRWHHWVKRDISQWYFMLTPIDYLPEGHKCRHFLLSYFDFSATYLGISNISNTKIIESGSGSLALVRVIFFFWRTLIIRIAVRVRTWNLKWNYFQEFYQWQNCWLRA